MKRLELAFKHWMFICLGIVSLGLVSCSEDTVDNINRDTALNIIRANKWFDVVKTISVAGEDDEREVLVGNEEGDYLEFKSNGFAYVYVANGETESYAYSMPSNKKMVFAGVEYDIQENLIQTITRFTLVNTTNGVTTKIVFRRR